MSAAPRDIPPLKTGKSFFSYLYASSPSRLIAAIALAILGGALDVVTLSIIGEGVRRQELSWTLAGLFVGSIILDVAMKLSSRLVLSHLVYSAVVELRMNLARRMLRTPLRNIEALGGAKVLAFLADDVGALSQLAWLLPEYYVSATVLVGGFIYLGWLSYQILITVAFGGFLAWLVGRYLRSRSMQRQHHLRETTDVLYQHFRTLADGAKNLKLQHHREQFFYDSLVAASLSQRALSLSVLRLSFPTVYLGQLSMFAIIGLLIFYAPLEVRNKAASVFAVLFITAPLGTLANMTPSLAKAAVIFRRIGESVFANDALLESRVERAPYALPWKRIALRGVTHTYHNEYADRAFTLGPIDLEFNPGEIVFIVGGNGSGKTTLAKIIMGLYPPETGAITVDDSRVDSDDLGRYRQLFSATFADSYIFESILGGNATSNDEACRALLKKLQLDHKVSIKDGAFSTVALSQGQRKRLALVSVYTEDRSFLVFDEWAADQDPMFKDFFYRTLLPELKAKGKTVVAISHDDRYFPCADRILTIENGQLT